MAVVDMLCTALIMRTSCGFTGKGIIEKSGELIYPGTLTVHVHRDGACHWHCQIGVVRLTREGHLQVVPGQVGQCEHVARNAVVHNEIVRVDQEGTLPPVDHGQWVACMRLTY